MLRQLRNLSQGTLLTLAFVQVATVATSQSLISSALKITASLPSSTIHVGDDLVVFIVTSNSSDHAIYVGQGSNGGLMVELINANGEDIGEHAMGGKTNPSTFRLTGGSKAVAPHETRSLTMHFRPESGYLVPGDYKLRVHRRDVGLGSEVYSNTVTLTVVP